MYHGAVWNTITRCTLSIFHLSVEGNKSFYIAASEARELRLTLLRKLGIYLYSWILNCPSLHSASIYSNERNLKTLDSFYIFRHGFCVSHVGANR